MKQMEQELTIELSNTEITVLVTKIHNMIRDGTYGQDYTICNRDKNRQLRKDYNINDTKIKEILLDLQIEDFVKAAKSNHTLHIEDIVYIFKKPVTLIPRWQEDAKDVNVMIYIKITWPSEAEDTMMLIISFHEDNI